ncbi:MAG: hypothetical protein M1823_002798 [Watsoniomyces obsoletus]|nr:MAG: hypothetical protein M1823_002798 [Watsoniomyces obsoletus]
MALRVTNVADVDRDPVSGRKLLNQYEIIDELGRGVHGKVKLGRNVEKNEDVAIKIVDRYSKRRRLGKLGDPEENVKREVAILKKAIHPHVVALLEVIDDPAKKKVYIVLEFVTRGEIEWRMKGVTEICQIERRRIDRGAQGLDDKVAWTDSERWLRASHQQPRPTLQHQDSGDQRRDGEQQQHQLDAIGAQYWSLEHGGGDADEEDEQQIEDDEAMMIMMGGAYQGGRRSSRTTNTEADADGRTIETATRSAMRATPQHSRQTSERALADLARQIQSPDRRLGRVGDTPQGSSPARHVAAAAAAASSGGGSSSDIALDRWPDRTASAAGSFISHRSSEIHYDPYEVEFSYVPCLTIEQARSAFRDTVLGLEYLHYQGIIHRDIKPANLLWTADHRVKISDFGVSYLGRPIRDEEDAGEDLSEADARPLDEAVELAKTVGTPAFYAPELCWTDLTGTRPPVTGQIDIWALGVTLYCLVYARVPILAENEFALFRAISEDRVYIPRRRLKPIHPPTMGLHPESSSSHAPSPTDNLYRRPDELVYEEIDDDLIDLFKRILEKDPTKRIMLKEIKRHPFTLHGIDDPIRWIEETDPARQYAGKKIEVSTEDVERAVVPIGFLARMRSGMRKMGAAIGLGAGREGRRRAKSSVHSQDGTTSTTSTSPTPTIRDERRRSVRGDDPMPPSSTTSRTPREGGHPLASSVVVTPEAMVRRDPFLVLTEPPRDGVPVPSHETGFSPFERAPHQALRPSYLERTLSASTASTATVIAAPPTESQAHTSPAPAVPPSLPEHPTWPEHPTAIGPLASSDLLGAIRRSGRRDSSNHGSRTGAGAELDPSGGGSRRQSLNLVRQILEDSRGEPSVALSTTEAHGVVEPSPHSSEGTSPIIGSGPIPAMLSRPSNRLSMPLPPRQIQDLSAIDPLASAPATPAFPPVGLVFERRHSGVQNTRAILPRELQGDTLVQFREVFYPYRASRESGPSGGGTSQGHHPLRAGISASASPELDGLGTSTRPQSERDLGPTEQEVVRQQESRPTSSRSGRPSAMPAFGAYSSSEQITSGMSQPNSYPSMPSVQSTRTSVSVEEPPYSPSGRDASSRLSMAQGRRQASLRPAEQAVSSGPSDDEAGYNGDTAIATDEDDDDEDDSDEGLVMTRRKSRARGSGKQRRSGSNPPRISGGGNATTSGDERVVAGQVDDAAQELGPAASPPP